MNFMINALTSMTVGEKLTYGGQMLLLGMGAVFAVLCIIFLCLTVFKFVFTKSSTPKSNEEPAPVVVTPKQNINTKKDEEIVAVIAAASAMAESESNGVKFKVVSFRRV